MLFIVRRAVAQTRSPNISQAIRYRRFARRYHFYILIFPIIKFFTFLYDSHEPVSRPFPSLGGKPEAPYPLITQSFLSNNSQGRAATRAGRKLRGIGEIVIAFPSAEAFLYPRSLSASCRPDRGRRLIKVRFYFPFRASPPSAQPLIDLYLFFYFFSRDICWTVLE